jgi:hypothetical protein
MKNRSFVWIGGGALLLAALLAVGAAQIKGSAGYAGAGPDFLPWTVSAHRTSPRAGERLPGSVPAWCSTPC